MLVALVPAADLAISTASGQCAASTLQPSLQQAATALAHKDLATAKAAISPAAACPAVDGVTYAAHVLRADLATREGDWATARQMLNGVGLHAESSLSAHAGFLRLRADQGLGDAAAFAADRTALLAANTARLTALGRKVETFRVGAAQVTAFEAPVDQGGFHRTLEFIVTPDDANAYPVSILLTDDRTALSLQQALSKSAAPTASHAWFIDLYTCNQHSTLPPPAQPFGLPPAYGEVKARVVSTLADATLVAAAPPPEGASCGTAAWLLPGLGQR